MTWAFQITIVDLAARAGGSKVMTFQRHHYQPDSGQRFENVFSSEFGRSVSGFPVRIRVARNSTGSPE